jgi:hypothetical protein
MHALDTYRKTDPRDAAIVRLEREIAHLRDLTTIRAPQPPTQPRERLASCLFGTALALLFLGALAPAPWWLLLGSAAIATAALASHVERLFPGQVPGHRLPAPIPLDPAPRRR